MDKILIVVIINFLYFSQGKTYFVENPITTIASSNDFIFEGSELKQLNPNYLTIIKKLDFGVTRKAIKALQIYVQQYDRFCEVYNVGQNYKEDSIMKIVYGKFDFFEAQKYCEVVLDGSVDNLFVVI